MTTSIAGRSEAALGGPASIIVRQRREHARLHELVGRVRDTAGTEQDEVLTQLCRLVFPHAFAEEAVLFPAARRFLGEGEENSLEIEQEHQEINEVYSALERSRRGDEGREKLIERAIALLDHDVRDEEDDLLPRLRERLDDRQLRRLGVSWEIARRVSPTRAHPAVSRRPPGQTLSALPLTVLDRSRDNLDRLARSAPAPVAAGSRAVSRALGTVAGLVEHLPPFERGEHPSTHTPRTELES
ncbi:MAG: Hemerythrin domain protein [uncultured Solirubrobacteraceae bacterium]|uniref:Hemerythrin domain protein n=1 Tax=uncultured Solirubrobacteraceae bacterium TaxID=1162706 RepID=A0A6J4RJ93_9ACTN|nr:MAG: Hemerythrin domain protein [uncultured Solirubrobacteraceae bacterium]